MLRSTRDSEQVEEEESKDAALLGTRKFYPVDGEPWGGCRPHSHCYTISSSFFHYNYASTLTHSLLVTITKCLLLTLIRHGNII